MIFHLRDRLEIDKPSPWYQEEHDRLGGWWEWGGMEWGVEVETETRPTR